MYCPASAAWICSIGMRSPDCCVSSFSRTGKGESSHALYARSLRPRRAPFAGRPFPPGASRLLRHALQESLWSGFEEERDAAEDSWWRMAEEDVSWLNACLRPARVSHYYPHLQAFFDAAAHRPGQAANHLRNARLAAVTLAKQAAVTTAVQRGPHPAPEQAPKPALTLLSCGICGQSFGTGQKPAVHRANMRGIRSAVDASPLMLLLNFHTRKRLIRHLWQDAPECSLALQTIGPRTCDCKETSSGFQLG